MNKNSDTHATYLNRAILSSNHYLSHNRSVSIIVTLLHGEVLFPNRSREEMGNIERASTSRSLVRIPISNESLYHATRKKNHGYSTSISMPTTRALIRASIDSDVDQHRGHVCSKAATTRGVV